MIIYYSFLYNEFSYSLFYGESNIKNSKIDELKTMPLPVTVQKGMLSGTINSSLTRKFLIEFDSVFNTIPVVTFVVNSANFGSNYFNPTDVGVSVGEVTRSSFTVSLTNPQLAAISFSADWIAQAEG